MIPFLKTTLRTAALLFAAAVSILGQTTGKIAGKVYDAKNNEPLPGVNVIIEGEALGAATDVNGDFFIINVRPNTYNVIIQMIGYEKVTVKDVTVSINSTSYLDIGLNETVIAGQEVVVEAERISSKKDQTSSVRNISSETIEAMPVEDMGGLVNMQAGVVNGHFRGGRSTEVSYMIDGIQVDDAFGGEAQVVGVETDAIQDLEVITGTFNAEYGRAMSGIVNAVTKEGENSFDLSAGAQIGMWLTQNDDIFYGINQNVNQNNDYNFQISGPIVKNKITFFSNVRMQDNTGHLNGIRRFNVDDYSNFMVSENLWVSEATGDSAVVPMSDSENLSVLTKLTLKPGQKLKLNILYTLNDNKWRNYDHAFKYNPDGVPYNYSKTNMISAAVNHMLSNKLFYEFRYSHFKNYYGNYMFENPEDTLNYVHDIYNNSDGPGFMTGGMSKTHNEHTLTDDNFKFDINWQINNNHNIKTGFQLIEHELDNSYLNIRNEFEGSGKENESYLDVETGKLVFPNYKPVVYGDSSIYSDIYNAKSRERAMYLQDKMEFDEMVLNFGVRYDYFDPMTVYPSDYRNPANQLSLPDSMMSSPLKSNVKTQISPRFGLAYQLSDVAILRFSYGHFFQMPPLYALYQNSSFRIAPGDYQTLLGNSELNAEKTVTYEIGLWQELTDGLGLEVALFYRDIYDLLSTKVISTYNQIEYGIYTNKDYGNARGLELKLDFARGSIYSNLNYTLQFTRGNADNPQQSFTRSGDQMDPIKKLIPMSWDQRHTLNASFGFASPLVGGTVTGYFNSGTPYSYDPIPESRLSNINLPPNNDKIPINYSLDMNAYLNLNLAGMTARLTLSVYNLLDRLNTNWVYADTGLPYTTIIRESQRLSHRSNFNTYEDVIQNPTGYSAPRHVKVGLSVEL